MLYMKEELSVKLKNEVLKFIAEGGDLYQTPAKSWPFYSTYRSFLRLNHFKNAEEVFEALGIEYDREYNRFYETLNKTKLIADENNELTDSRSAAVAAIKVFADELNCTPSDYLILMSPYRMKKAFKRTNYINHVIRELRREFPDGDITGIKTKNPRLYERISVIVKNLVGEGVSRPDVMDLLGVSFSGNGCKKPAQIKRSRINDSEVYSEYKQKKDQIKNLAADDRELYSKILVCATRFNISVYDWFVVHGETPPENSNRNTNRLSICKVDKQAREQELLEKRAEIIKRLKIKRPANKCEAYYYDKYLAKLTLDELEQSEVAQDEMAD